MSSTLWADRIRKLPPYLFAEIDRIKQELRNGGMDIIDLSIGDPDLPTPKIIIEKLCEEAQKSANHRYPSYQGSARFRKAVSLWYEDRFGVSLDPEKEVLALIGSKEGIAHTPLALMNPGEATLVPDPGYPVYQTATEFAGGIAIAMPLKEENQFRPQLQVVSSATAGKAKLMFLNYPNNPTAAVADLGWFEELNSWAKKHGIFICHDNAYSEVAMGGYEPASYLQTKEGKELGIEFHSLSKTFNMTGWRVGFAVGRKDAIAALGKIKTNVDSGVFTAIQEAGITALENWKELRDANNRIYEHRRDIVAEGLKRLNVKFILPRATFYVWCHVPTKESSAEFCARILKKTGISLTPGIGFGEQGESYFRISLTATEVRLQEALARIDTYLKS